MDRSYLKDLPRLIIGILVLIIGLLCVLVFALVAASRLFDTSSCDISLTETWQLVVVLIFLLASIAFGSALLLYCARQRCLPLLLIFVLLCFQNKAFFSPIPLYLLNLMPYNITHADADKPESTTRMAFVAVALWLNPSDIQALRTRSEYFAALNQPKLAIQDLDRAISTSNDYSSEPKYLAPTLSDIACLYLRRGEHYAAVSAHHTAIEDFTKFIDLNADHAESRISRAESYFAVRNFEAALADLNVAINHGDGYEAPGARGLRAEVYERLGKYGLAVCDLTNLIEIRQIHPESIWRSTPDMGNEHATLHYRRGKLYKMLGRQMLATSDFTRARSLCKATIKEYEPDLEGLGWVYYVDALSALELGDKKQAKKLAEKARELKYESSDWKKFGLI